MAGPGQKLHSRRGVTLIITMVFFLICSFVGGTVLAAATSNGGRLAALKKTRQEYLSQRSAAQLLQSQFTMADGTKNILTVTDETTTTTVTTTLTGGGTSQTTSTGHKLTFTAPAGAAGIQRMLYETAVQRYLAQNNISYSQPMTFNHFEFGGSAVPLSSFCPVEGTCTVSLSEGGGTLETVTAQYTCSGSTATLGSFSVVLGGSQQLTLYLRAGITAGAVQTVTDSSTVGNVHTDKKIDTQTTTVVWEDPVVRKGGAS